MFNNRMLAVAAVLVMAVPALGAATPIVVPPVPEQLVEGHTVFTVIEIAAVTNTSEVRFAAAVAVLVREYAANNAAQRFPGVLWFNDQYLVNPEQSESASKYFRYPCGGAVMAVNRGDPDPRVVIARIGDGGAGDTTIGPSSYTYDSADYWTKPYPGTYSYENDYAWIGVDPDATEVYSDTVIGSLAGDVDGNTFGFAPPWDYEESYLITDPNDHSWVIDKYNFYTRDGVSGLQNVNNLNSKLGVTTDPLETIYEFPVWVVNILGTPVFAPDYGNSVGFLGERFGENCAPFKDLLEDVLAPAQLPCGFNSVSYDTGVAEPDPYVNPADLANTNLTATSGNNVTVDEGFDQVAGYSGVPPWTDDPCAGYEDPGATGYCYGGQAAGTTGCETVHGPTGNCNYNVHKDGSGAPATCADGSAGFVNKPLRQYNALLYFELHDLRVFSGETKDHNVGSADYALDTNGCAEEQYTWGPNPPLAAYDWQCPNMDDNAEGNSHPFHPTAHTPPDVEQCIFDPTRTNHGGSTYVPVYTEGGAGTDWYKQGAPCDYVHTTRDIDVYFSPGGRPFPPVIRVFTVTDLEGSAAPFNGYDGTPAGH